MAFVLLIVASFFAFCRVSWSLFGERILSVKMQQEEGANVSGNNLIHNDAKYDGPCDYYADFLALFLILNLYWMRWFLLKIGHFTQRVGQGKRNGSAFRLNAQGDKWVNLTPFYPKKG